MQMKRLWIAFLAVAGILVAVSLGWAVQVLTSETIPMYQTASDVGYDLAPGGREAKKADSGISNEKPAVAIVDANGKVKILSGHPSSGGAGYRVNNQDADRWDD